MIKEFKVDWNADCGQVNLTRNQKQQYKKKKLKQTKHQCP